MVDPITAITTIDVAVSTVQKLVSLAGTIKNAELKLLVADLTLEIAQTKTTMAGLIDENRQLKATIASTSKAKPNVTFKDNLYYTENGDGPFCTACFDTKDKLVRVTEAARHFQSFGKYKCNACNSYYGGRK